MTSPIRLLFSFLLSLALHRCLLIEIRERRYTPPRTRPNARRIDRCTLVLRIWRPESSSLWLDGRLNCVRMRCCKCRSSCSSRTAIKRIPTRIPASAGHAPKRPTMDPAIGGRARRLPCPTQPAATPRCTQREPHTEGKYEEVCSNRTKKLKNNTSRVSRPAISSTSRLLG